MLCELSGGRQYICGGGNKGCKLINVAVVLVNNITAEAVVFKNNRIQAFVNGKHSCFFVSLR